MPVDLKAVLRELTMAKESSFKAIFEGEGERSFNAGRYKGLSQAIEIIESYAAPEVVGKDD